MFDPKSQWRCKHGKHVGLIVVIIRVSGPQVVFNPTRSGAASKTRDKTWRLPLDAFTARYERIK